jgi:hypothetical protein
MSVLGAVEIALSLQDTEALRRCNPEWQDLNETGERSHTIVRASDHGNARMCLMVRGSAIWVDMFLKRCWTWDSFCLS